MSGGSLNYIYSRVEQAAIEVKIHAETTLHHAFASHLFKVSKALHDLEWLFSSDYGPGDEIEALESVVSPQEQIETAMEMARKAQADLEAVINKYDGLHP